MIADRKLKQGQSLKHQNLECGKRDRGKRMTRRVKFEIHLDLNELFGRVRIGGR